MPTTITKEIRKFEYLIFKLIHLARMFFYLLIPRNIDIFDNIPSVEKLFYLENKPLS